MHDGKQNTYARLLRIQSKAGGGNGYLAHLKKSISIYAGDSKFKVHKNDRPFAEWLIETNSHPDELLLELSQAFQADLWFDGSKCYQDGKQAKSATICLGPLGTRDMEHTVMVEVACEPFLHDKQCWRKLSGIVRKAEGSIYKGLY